MASLRLVERKTNKECRLIYFETTSQIKVWQLLKVRFKMLPIIFSYHNGSLIWILFLLPTIILRYEEQTFQTGLGLISTLLRHTGSS